MKTLAWYGLVSCPCNFLTLLDMAKTRFEERSLMNWMTMMMMKKYSSWGRDDRDGCFGKE